MTNEIKLHDCPDCGFTMDAIHFDPKQECLICAESRQEVILDIGSFYQDEHPGLYTSDARDDDGETAATYFIDDTAFVDFILDRIVGGGESKEHRRGRLVFIPEVAI